MFDVESQLITIGDIVYFANAETREWDIDSEAKPVFGRVEGFIGPDLLQHIAMFTVLEEATLDGVAVYHLRGTVPATTLGEQGSDRQITVDYWIGRDDLLIRRIAASGNLEARPGNAASSRGAIDNTFVSMNLQFSNFDQIPVADPPSLPRPATPDALPFGPTVALKVPTSLPSTTDNIAASLSTEPVAPVVVAETPGSVINPSTVAQESPKTTRDSLSPTAITSLIDPDLIALSLANQSTDILVIAVPSVGIPSGVPHLCTSGCAESIYLSGITETLFNSVELADGIITTEPMLAMEFSLDPSLRFGDFQLRKGVKFHNGWGELTANDVAFSFNEANSNINRESIHGQAGSFANLIQTMQPIDDYVVRLNYQQYDSRGLLHGFSTFWQTAGIMSQAVFDQYGAEGLNAPIVGVGPFVVEEWNANEGIFLHAFEDYWGAAEGLGPFVDYVRWVPAQDAPTRRAMLETGEADIADVALLDSSALVNAGYEEQVNGRLNAVYSVSFAGNYWEMFRPQEGKPLDRDRDLTKPWVGDPFEFGGSYNENTPSMINARKVRNAFAWAIDRDQLTNRLLGGLGWANHQPYLSANDSNYQSAWSWGTDFDTARQLMSEAGVSPDFNIDLWIGATTLGSELGEALGIAWQDNLGVTPSLIRTAYSTYRPGLVVRTATTPGSSICGVEERSNFPYDWARGFAMSSLSSGSFGIGQELPYATETYLAMSAETNKSKRQEFASEFFEQNRFWANCVGVFEHPIRPIFNPNRIAYWDQRPNANSNLGSINNVRSIRLSQ